MAVRFLWPVPGFYRVTSGFRTAERPSHMGIDIGRNVSPPLPIDGARIVAVAEGVVTGAGSLHESMGNWLEVTHPGGWVSRYMHNRENRVKRGDAVRMGEVIGLVGSTGRSTGPHLHIELIRGGAHVDPLDCLCRDLRAPAAVVANGGPAPLWCGDAGLIAPLV